MQTTMSGSREPSTGLFPALRRYSAEHSRQLQTIAMETDTRPQNPLDSPRVCGVPDQSALAGAIEQQVVMMSLELIGSTAKETRYGIWQKKR
jgi:hypothetical protein